MPHGSKKVVILGGGVAGMSAAHELIGRGFQVEVFERKSIPGGKARSLVANAATGLMSFGGRNFAKSSVLRPPLPGEHGFRFFPGFYRHVVDTMERIPYGERSVADNLVDTSELQIASFDRPPYVVPAESPRTLGDLKVGLFAVVAALSGQLGIAAEDGLFFAAKMWEFVTSCEERRLVELERVNWWDFIEAGSRSAPYQKYFGSGITRSLVAAKARRASTKTIGNIFLQIVFDVLTPGVAADRVLNGPTNDVWLNPWLEHLRKQGVVYHFDAQVRSIQCSRGVVSSASVVIDDQVRQVTGDYFIGALPIERMAELISAEMLAADPSLANLSRLTEYVEWMNGIQYFLTEDVPMAKGHVIYIDTPWALTSVSQPQFWKAINLADYGDGNVRGLLSVDISDWDVDGFNGKQAQHCSRREIALETWEQLKRSVNVSGAVLRDEQLHSWFLDPGISDTDADADPSTPQINTNAEPLLVNYVDTWHLRPESVTRIPNFFLASDYVRTFTDLATMEAANEAARRAVNGIIYTARSGAEPCKLWNLHEPEVFLPFQAYDKVRYRRGLPWNGGAMDYVNTLLAFSKSVSTCTQTPDQRDPVLALQDSIRRILGTAPELVAVSDDGARMAGVDSRHTSNSPPTADVEQASAEARASSDEGLRRLRIVRAAS